MISIIIPVHNGADTIIDTLKSIARQTFQDYEVIIVDDGSTDGLIEKLAAYSGLLYRLIHQEKRGAPAARNRGAKEARGEYLLFCDDDAVLAPQALVRMLGALEQSPAASYSYSSFYWGRKFFAVGPFDPEKLRRLPCIHTIALIRHSDFPASGWDESIKKFQDWDLWLTMLDQEKTGVFIDEALFRVKTGGVMSAWLPSFAYRLLPFLPRVKKYEAAKKIIKEKHGLS